jgi:hypothetical protein
VEVALAVSVAVEGLVAAALADHGDNGTHDSR